MSQPPRRPARTSRPTRTPTSRPRRVAGQRPGAADTPAVDEPTAEAHDAAPERVEPAADEPRAQAARPVLEKHVPPGATAESDAGDDVVTPVRGRPAARRRVPLLAAAVVLLLGTGAAEGVYLARDDEPSAGRLSAERPVQAPELEVRRVVDQAATAAKLILSGSSKDYDGQVAKATATMTEPFAAKYRATKADIEKDFVAQQTEVVIDVSAQGVVTATDQEVVALLFLTQTTQKGTRGGVTPVQYRVTVTMTDTADGWLVSDLKAL